VFKCSGIRHCEYAHEDILRVCPAYNRVKVESINDLRKRSSCPYQVAKVDKKLKQSTEKYSLYIIIYISNILTINSYYHGVIQSWKQCIYPGTQERICSKSRLTMFFRHGASICAAHARHMLIAYRSSLLDVQVAVIWNHGILLGLYHQILPR